MTTIGDLGPHRTPAANDYIETERDPTGTPVPGMSTLRSALYLMSGDVTATEAGVVTIANDAVDNDKLANITRGSVKVGGAANAPTDLVALTLGAILIGNGTDIISTTTPAFTGVVAHGGNRISGVGTATTDTDAATVDGALGDERIVYTNTGKLTTDAALTFDGTSLSLDGTLTTTGNVGVGVTPSVRLHVKPASADNARIFEWEVDWGTTKGGIQRSDFGGAEQGSIIWSSGAVGFAPSIATGATAADSNLAITIRGNSNIGIRTINQFGEGAGVIGIANAGTNPSTNPIAGGVLYSDSGAGKWRGSGGTTTTFGPAEPHCPRCDMDYAVEYENDKYGHFAVCMPCLLEEINRLGGKLKNVMIPHRKKEMIGRIKSLAV